MLALPCLSAVVRSEEWRRSLSVQSLKGISATIQQLDRGAPSPSDQGREEHDPGWRNARHWTKALVAQIDREGRWTIKRGRKRDAPPGWAERRAVPEIAVPMFGYKNHVGIDRELGFVRRYVVTPAAAHDGA